MQDSTKKFLLSVGRTFIATFFATLYPAIASGGISWTWSFWIPIVAGAINATIRAMTDSSVPVALGGTKTV